MEGTYKFACATWKEKNKDTDAVEEKKGCIDKWLCGRSFELNGVETWYDCADNAKYIALTFTIALL